MRDGIWTDAILFFDWFERQSTVDRRPKLKRAASHQTNLFLPVKFYFCRKFEKDETGVDGHRVMCVTDFLREGVPVAVFHLY